MADTPQTRLRNATTTFDNQHVQLLQVLENNQAILCSQAKTYNKLFSEQNALMIANTHLVQDINDLNERHDKTQTMQQENDQLREKVSALEEALATCKVEYAVNESEILTKQLQLNKLEKKEQRVKERVIQERCAEQDDQKTRARVWSITKTSSRYSDILRIEENYTDEVRRQWIKILKTKEPSRYETINAVKAKCKSLIRGFIPIDLRRLGWSVLIDNKLSLTEQLYCYHNDHRRVPEKILLQIDKDIDRSFPNISEVQKNFAVELKEIIQIFHCYRPDISYVQGMTYPAGILLLVLDKYKAWQSFCNLILTTQVVYKMYIFDLQNIAHYCRAFDLLLEQSQPKVAERLKYYGIHSEIYLIEWFYTMFSRSFSVPTVFKIWDYLIFYGECILYQVSLAIFQQLKTHILELDYEQSIELVKNFQSKVLESKVLQDLVSNKFSHTKLRWALDKVMTLNGIPTTI